MKELGGFFLKKTSPLLGKAGARRGFRNTEGSIFSPASHSGGKSLLPVAGRTRSARVNQASRQSRLLVRPSTAANSSCWPFWDCPPPAPASSSSSRLISRTSGLVYLAGFARAQWPGVLWACPRFLVPCLALLGSSRHERL